jgi:hypothetical protein
MVSTRALIFHMSIPCDKTFPLVEKNDLNTSTLVFDILIENINLGYIFWLVGTRVLTFDIRVLCGRPSCGYQKFDLVTLTLVFDLHVENFSLVYIFRIVWTRTLIFHASIPCDKTFPWVQYFLTLWPWPWCLTYLLKMLTLVISFEW